MRKTRPPLSELRDLRPFARAGLTVAPSRIHGLGVLATTPIQAHEELFHLGGFLLPSGRRRAAGVLASTAIGVAEEVVLAELWGSERDLSDHLNHSCEPNAGFRDALCLVATRSIMPAEEVTVDYAYWEAEESWRLNGQCRCKSACCRLTITGVDYRRPELSSRMLSWAAPFVRRRLYELWAE